MIKITKNSNNLIMKKFFEGWYFKQQNKTDVLAFIIGVQYDKNKKGGCFIQVINSTNTYNFNFDLNSYSYDKNNFVIKLDKNTFSKSGIELDIETPEIKIKGKLSYNNLQNIKYNIMGPFAFFPFMECKHGVVSCHHNVNGSININNTKFSFFNNDGYIEKDWGNSFPTKYFWSHAYTALDNITVLVSLATIPYLGINFDGFFCIIKMPKKEYRLATYLGGKIVDFTKNNIKIKQGKYVFEAVVLENNELVLNAPINGEMTRNVFESAKGKVRYTLYKNKEKICDFTCNLASSEYVKTPN